MTEQVADAAIKQACRRLRLPTVHSRVDEFAGDVQRDQML